MKSHFVNDGEIKKLLSYVKKHPSNSLKEIIDEFNFNSLPVSDKSKCEKIVGVDGSVKLIAERINYFNSSLNNYQTYVIDPIIFIRTISVYSSNPFIKEDEVIIKEELNHYKLEYPDRTIALRQMESNLLKLKEMNHIKDLVKEMTYGSILLLDMALISVEDDLKMKNIINECRKKGINIVGWVKDSDIKTDDGLLYTAAAKSSASQQGIKPPWFAVHPKFKDKDINVFLYHPPWGNFVFRTDIISSSLSIPEIFNTLINCSKHSLGYPLALYKAHQRVKITQNDADNMFRKMKKISASEGDFIDRVGEKPFHETYLDL
jgi:SepF-like predicted cell division protein (DUF552 family)